MSIQAMSWALSLELSELGDPAARHVLMALANYAGEDGKAAFPSKETIRLHTGLSIRTIGYKLELLKENGLISEGNQGIAAAYISRTDRRPTVYDLALKRGASTASRDNKRGASLAPRKIERGATDDSTGCNLQHNGVQPETERGAPVAPNTSFNHQVTVKEEELAQSTLPFSMHLDWQPNMNQLKPRAVMSGVKVELFTSEVIGEFKIHFEASGRSATSAQWLASLIGWVKRNQAWSAKAGKQGSEQADPNDISWSYETEHAL